MKYAVFILIIFSFSCSTNISGIGVLSKYSKENLSNASTEFADGWRDGCETGMSAGSTVFYKMFHKTNKIDGYKAAASKDYRVAWNNSFWVCYRGEAVDQKKKRASLIYGGIK